LSVKAIKDNCWDIKVARQQIYTHISNKDIGRIKSSLDNLQIKWGKDDQRWEVRPGDAYGNCVRIYRQIERIYEVGSDIHKTLYSINREPLIN